jgi:adenosine kinase
MANLENSKILYTSCFFITSNYDALIEVGKYAAASGKPLGLNLSAVFLIQFEGDKVRQALEYADYLFCNEDEADAFAKYNNIEHSSRADIAVALAKWTKINTERQRTVLITQGSHPIIVAIGQKDAEPEIREFQIPTLTKEQLVDTNGAGDSFVGGFLAQLAQDKDLDTCVRCGTYLSA